MNPGLTALRETLSQRWLSMVPPFDNSLIDLGERFRGHPVFTVMYFDIQVKVYRYTPVNSEHPVLAFVPE